MITIGPGRAAHRSAGLPVVTTVTRASPLPMPGMPRIRVMSPFAHLPRPLRPAIRHAPVWLLAVCAALAGAQAQAQAPGGRLEPSERARLRQELRQQAWGPGGDASGGRRGWAPGAPPSGGQGVHGMHPPQAPGYLLWMGDNLIDPQPQLLELSP